MFDRRGTDVNVLAARLDREALRDIWPIVLGMAPFGLLIGVTIGHTGVGTVLGLGSAAVFFGGSGHLAALTLLAAGAGPLAVLAGVVVVNARLRCTRPRCSPASATSRPGSAGSRRTS
jgi:predicted branched-subunit amino acid permease